MNLWTLTRLVSPFLKVGNNQDDNLSGKSCKISGRIEKTCRNVSVGCSVSGHVT